MDTPEKVENAKAFQNELNALLKKYNLKIGAKIDFPIYKKLPIELQLALEVIKNHQVSYNVVVEENIK